MRRRWPLLALLALILGVAALAAWSHRRAQLRADLSAAVVDGDLAQVRLLIEAGATPEEFHVEWEYSGSDSKVRTLVDHGPRLLLRHLEKRNPDVTSAREHTLSNAIWSPEPELLQTLLDSGVDPNVPCEDGQYPLHLVARCLALELHYTEPGGQTTVETWPLMLMNLPGQSWEIGPNPERGPFGSRRYASAQVTVSYGVPSAERWVVDAQALLDHAADPNVRDAEGLTPLHWAAARKDADLVSLLLEHGADPGLADNQGRTVLDVFETAPPGLVFPGDRKQKGDVATLLREAMDHPFAATE